MTDQPIGPMGGQELDNLRLTLDGMSERALLRADGVITWWDAARLIARLDAEIARANAAEAERDAALARSLPAPVKMETVEQVEALPSGYYLGDVRHVGGSISLLRRQERGLYSWPHGAIWPLVSENVIGAYITPLPDLPIPTSEEG